MKIVKNSISMKFEKDRISNHNKYKYSLGKFVLGLFPLACCLLGFLQLRALFAVQSFDLLLMASLRFFQRHCKVSSGCYAKVLVVRFVWSSYHGTTIVVIIICCLLLSVPPSVIFQTS